MLQCDLHDLDSKEEYLESIATYARTHPDEPWILGGGWSQDVFPRGCPAKEDLDAVVSDRPVYPAEPRRPQRLGQLQGAGDRGDHRRHARSRRTAASSATRTARRRARCTRARRPSSRSITPPLSPDDRLRGPAEGPGVPALARHHRLAGRDRRRLGATGNYQAYLAAAGRGDAHRPRRRRPVVGPRARVSSRSTTWSRCAPGGTAGRFAATSVKIMQDGVCENFTGATIDPYLDEHGHPTDNNGLSFVEPELLKEAVTRLDALGFQVHFHALADRAVREALDAIEAARAHERLQRSAPPPGAPADRASRRPPAVPHSSARSRTRSRCGRRTRPRWTS